MILSEEYLRWREKLTSAEIDNQSNITTSPKQTPVLNHSEYVKSEQVNSLRVDKYYMNIDIHVSALETNAL